MESTTELPEIDISAFTAAPASAAGHDFVARLRDVCHGPGFCYLVGHGVPAQADDAIMAVAGEFFALPEAERRALAIASSPHFRGYTMSSDERRHERFGASNWTSSRGARQTLRARPSSVAPLRGPINRIRMPEIKPATVWPR